MPTAVSLPLAKPFFLCHVVTLLLTLLVPTGSFAQLSGTQNYVATTTVLQAGTTTEAAVQNLAASGRQQQVTYLDGLGRPVQQVNRASSPQLTDVVIPVAYDAMGRASTTYLPYVAGFPGSGVSGAATADGSFKANPVTQQQSFYTVAGDRIANNATPSVQTVYEASPLGRVVKQGQAGTAWQPGTTHSLKFVNRTNGANEVRQWACDATGAWSSTAYYASNTLAVKESLDEQNSLTTEYVDQEGRTVAKKVSAAQTGCSVQSEVVSSTLQVNALPGTIITGIRAATWGRVLNGTTCDDILFDTGRSTDVTTIVRSLVASQLTSSVTSVSVPIDWQLLGPDPYPGNDKSLLVVATCVATTTPAADLLTYYAYDDFGNLRLVVPPAGVREIPISGSWTASAAFIQKWCFAYTYDERQRMVSKQVPGAGTFWYVYNRRNQVVLTRDANNNNIFSKYDALGRLIMTGIYYSSATIGQLQATANSLVLQYESVVPGTGTNLFTYTLTNSFPTDINESYVRTRAFYDAYTYDALGTRSFAPVSLSATAISTEPGQAPFSVTNDDYSAQVAGLVTIQQERDTYFSKWLTTVFYYDDKERVIQTLTDHLGGGQERTTLKLSFTGQILQSYLQHAYPTAAHPTSPFEEHTIYQENIYDPSSRLIQTNMKVDGQAKLTLAAMEYNGLGQLVDKKLHSTDGGASFLQSVDYRYNIRGWLININNRNLENNTWLDDTDPNSDNLRNGGGTDAYNTASPLVEADLFGLELKYDDRHTIGLTTAQHPAQYNGNVATSLWKTRNSVTGNKLRAYAYYYDPLNRLTDARYRTYEYNSSLGNYKFDVYDTDYSTTDVAYDANGNITDMTRQGDSGILGQPALLDQLHYTYSPTDGNRLIAVDDAANSYSTTVPTHDFEDNGHVYGWNGINAPAEYTYDAAGNLISDLNKGISYIYYGALNKPEYIEFSGNNDYAYIEYIYSASGTKLRKMATSYTNSGWVTHTTDYVGGFVYEDQVLSFAPTPEGRVLYTDNSFHRPWLDWKYEYHLRDHLGNLRFAFRDADNNVQQRTAGMEPVNAPVEEAEFKHVADTRRSDPQHARTGDYVSYLNRREGRREGPGMTLAVAAGDSVYAEVYGRYDHAPAAGRLARKGALVAGAVVTNDPLGQASDQTQTTSRRGWRAFIGASVAIMPQLLKPRRDVLPSAFLRYELFSKDSQLVATRTNPLQRTTTDTWQQLKTGLRADSAGYVTITLINESDTPAYFDDLLLRPVDGTKVQENHYDPWGLNLVGIETQGEPNSKFQYNGKEKQEDFGLNWLDYGARMYDAQLGRWHSVDPLADAMRRYSPYSYGGLNPVRYIDVDGMFFDDYFSKTGRYLGSDNATTNNVRTIDESTYSNIISNPEAHSNYDNQNASDPTLALQSNSTLISIPSESAQQSYMSDLYTTGNGEGHGTGHEINVYMVLNADKGTLGFQVASGASNNESAEVSVDRPRNPVLAGSVYVPGAAAAATQPSEGGEIYDSGQLIVGLAHPHPEPKRGTTLVSGVSTTTNPSGGNDLQTARDFGVPVYAIDKRSIHKVDQNGKVTNNLPRTSEVLRNALETRAGIR